MIGDYLTRLAVALPLVLLLAIAVIWAVKRGRLAWPIDRAHPPAPPAPLEIVASRALTATSRVAVVRFDGRDHLLAVSGGTVMLVAVAATAGGRP